MTLELGDDCFNFTNVIKAVFPLYTDRNQGMNSHPAQQEKYQASKKRVMWENSVNSASGNSKPKKLIHLHLNTANVDRLNVCD